MWVYAQGKATTEMPISMQPRNAKGLCIDNGIENKHMDGNELSPRQHSPNSCSANLLYNATLDPQWLSRTKG